MPKPRILITGSSGFSGKHIVKYLHKQTYPTFVHNGHKSGNLSQSMGGPFNVDVLIHTAAVSPSLNKGPIQLIDNIEITKNLIKFAKNRVQKIIFFSSVSLYGEVHNGLLTTLTPRTNPSVYGETKHICEELLFESGIPTVSLRLPSVVGKGAHRHKLAYILNQAKNHEPIVYHSPHALFNNVVHIDFLCLLIKKIIEAPSLLHFEALPLCSKDVIPMEDVVDILASPFGPYTTQVLSNVGSPNFVIDTYSLSQFMKPWTTIETLQRYVYDDFQGYTQR